jgi:hypothetical protein
MTRVLLIVGTSFCGSTLTSFFLNAHPQLTSVGEATGPDLGAVDMSVRDYYCSCGEKMGDCSMWRAVSERASDHGVRFTLQDWDTKYQLGSNPVLRFLLSRSLRSGSLDRLRDKALHHIPRLQRRLAELDRRNAVVAESLIELADAQIFVDASKDPMRARHLDRAPRIDLKVLHLTRDSLGFVASNLRKNMRSISVACRTWNRNAAQMRQVARDLRDDQVLHVRYEDLCLAPVSSLKRITTFLDVEPFVHPVRFRDAEHHIIGNAMRRRKEDQISLDERWRSELSTAEIDEIAARTRSYRDHFGYPEIVRPATGRRGPLVTRPVTQ